MPYSYNLFKNEVKEHFLEYVSPKTKILDVGGGCGTYAHLLKNDFPNIDTIEIWERYVEEFKLRELYNNVIIGDIRTFDFSNYDYIIMGDVLEHLTFEDAQKILDKIKEQDIICMVAVPYNYEQGEYMGNVHETHLQPDLTKEIFLERYPSMNFLMGDDKYGYFINYELC